MTKSELKKLLKDAVATSDVAKRVTAKRKLEREHYQYYCWATDGVSLFKYSVRKENDHIAIFTVITQPVPKLVGFKWEEGAKYHL